MELNYFLRLALERSKQHWEIDSSNDHHFITSEAVQLSVSVFQLSVTNIHPWKGMMV